MSADQVELDRDVAVGLANLLVVVADNKYWLGLHLSEWSVGAPGLETSVAAAAISQGHLGQSRALLPIADDLAGDDVELSAPTERERRYNLAVLDEPFATWVDAVAAVALVDPALDVLVGSLEGIPEELDRRVGRVLEESRFHADFSRGRLRDLVEGYPTCVPELTARLRTVLVEVLCWFGPPGEQGVENLVDAGVLALDNEGLRQRWLRHVGPMLVELLLDVGVARDGERWDHPDLPWDDWNRLQRRLER